jgi:hypothetical protein
MRIATDTAHSTPTRIGAPRVRSLALTVAGAVLVGLLAGWATYLVATPGATLSAGEIASIRAAEMVEHYRAQWLDSPQGIAYLRAAELPELYAAAWSIPPQYLDGIRAAEMVEHYRAQWLDSPQGIAYLRAAELPELHADAWLTPQRIAAERAADMVGYYEGTYEPSP